MGFKEAIYEIKIRDYKKTHSSIVDIDENTKNIIKQEASKIFKSYIRSCCENNERDYNDDFWPIEQENILKHAYK